jgi:hypothetical protein
VEQDVQQRDPGRLGSLRLGHEDDSAGVAATARDEHLLRRRNVTLRADECVAGVDARREIARDPSPLDDRNGGIGQVRIPLDAVAREADDLGDGGVESAAVTSSSSASGVPTLPESR